MNDDARRRADAFVREVEAAMADVPQRWRAELTAGLADHLLEPGDDGRRLIDAEDLDPRTYAEELRAAAPPTGDRPRGRRLPLLAGAALLTLVVAGGTWAAATQPWYRDAPEPMPTASPTPEVELIYMPDVRGMSRYEATIALQNLGFSVTFVKFGEGEPLPGSDHLPSDTVAQTDPPPGDTVPDGTEVVILVTP